MTMDAGGPPELVDAQVAFHLNAGVDFVIAVADGSDDVLARYERDGHARVLRERGDDVRTRAARLAATEQGADWVIVADVGEFWWPRGESLKDVLGPIPPRYTIVQGLRRDFVGSPGGNAFEERLTMRPSFEHAALGSDAPRQLLRPVFRADPDVVVGERGIELARNVPLRAWYPIEVLRLSGEGSIAMDDAALVEDLRLRDALRTLREAAPPGGSFALPAADDTRLSFRVPDIVDDARYAIECAAVGEVDLPRVEQYVAELERRVAWLEQRFWPRVRRKLARLVRS